MCAVLNLNLLNGKKNCIYFPCNIFMQLLVNPSSIEEMVLVVHQVLKGFRDSVNLKNLRGIILGFQSQLNL